MINMNAFATARNPYQTDAKRVLCVCSAGLLRSPTAANVLHKLYGHNTRSAGVTQEYALIPVNDLLIHWADEIVCMENSHRDSLKIFDISKDKPIKVLGIRDIYPWGDDLLIAAIKENYVND